MRMTIVLCLAALSACAGVPTLEAVDQAVHEACAGRAELSGPYPLDCGCIRACVAAGEEDCIGLCD